MGWDWKGVVAFVHTGMVRAPSLPTFALVASAAEPAWTFCGSGGLATSRLVVLAAISSPSRRFHSARTSADGAQPRIPGWMRPAKRTWGICREEQKMPSKSQMAFALDVIVSAGCRSKSAYEESSLRFRVEFVQEATPVLRGEDAREAPRPVLEGLHVLDFY